MNVLFISNDPSLFVENSATRARMRSYAEEIGELHILSRAPKASVYEEGPLHIHGVAAGRLLAPFVLARKARALIATHSIEVVSAQDPFEHGWAAMTAVKGTSAALHIQIHTDFLSPWFVRSDSIRSAHVRMPLLNRIRRALAGSVLPKAHGIRVVSNRIKDSLVHLYGSRIAVPSVIPIEVAVSLPEAIPLPPHAFTFSLITASRLEPEKRIEDILEALARIIDQYPSAGLFIVGEGRERTILEHQVTRLGLQERVVFLGERSLSDTLGLMQSATAFIQASAYEGYGRTLIEAALSRIPIITTDVGIVGEVFKGYTDVLSAPVADPAALAVHIVGLIEDQQKRKLLALSAEQTALAHLASYGSQATRIAQDLAQATYMRDS